MMISVLLAVVLPVQRRPMEGEPPSPTLPRFAGEGALLRRG